MLMRCSSLHSHSSHKKSNVDERRRSSSSSLTGISRMRVFSWLLFFSAGTVASVAEGHDPDLETLDWASLRSSLTSQTSLTFVFNDTDNAQWLEQCSPVFAAEDFRFAFGPAGRLAEGSNYQLVDQPAGLCSYAFACAWRYCDWSPTNLYDLLSTTPWPENLPFEPEAVPDEDWNLPAAVVHPRTAGDVVAAVEFALKNHVGMSVKATGHSYTGSHTDKDSILINMRQYPKYLVEGGFLTECPDILQGNPQTSPTSRVKEEGVNLTTADLRAQACRVATSRGWSAIMRVGGGTLFDEAYRSVSNFNRIRSADKDGNWTYHMLGGGSGTVGAAGGWLSATGIAATNGGRLFGFGVDQVTQMEMVLPTGHHVRFGPTEWTDDDTLAWPRTTKVTGWCNTNPSSPEEDWQWQVCPDNAGIGVSFDDLWHAVRGGGGGFGVVLSVEYQLPDWPGEISQLKLENPDGFEEELAALCGSSCDNQTAALAWVNGNFRLDAYYNPTAVNLTVEQSNLCQGVFNEFFCFGEGGQLFSSAYAAVVESNRDYFLEAGFTDELVDMIRASIVLKATNKDYAELALSLGEFPGVPSGRIADQETPMLIRNFAGMAIHTPIDYVNSEEGRSVLFDIPPYTIGGNHATHHDGTTATSRAYRGSAFFSSLGILGGDDLKTNLLMAYVGDGTPQDSFPPMGEFNHMQELNMGPLKTNWSVPCPIGRRSERDEMCISKLEFIFGTEGLARLEAIKAAADPEHMFNCYGCVGFKEHGKSTPTSSTEAPTTSPPSAAVRPGLPFAWISGAAVAFLLGAV